MKKKYELLCMICFMILFFNFFLKNVHSEVFYDDYDGWNSIIKYLIEKDKAKDVSEINGDEIKHYAIKISELIIDKDVNALLENVSKSDFRFYYIKGQKGDNFINKFHDDLINRKDFYNFIFDKKKFFVDFPSEESGHTKRGQLYDVRRYLEEYKDKLIWKILYFPKEDVYEVWFSIPNDLLAEFDYFHYRIKKIDGKLLLIGF